MDQNQTILPGNPQPPVVVTDDKIAEAASVPPEKALKQNLDEVLREDAPPQTEQ
jgi:hypothetical protein